MLNNLLRKVVGSKNDRDVKRMHKKVPQINALEAELEAISDAELQGKTAELRQRLEAGESLDSLLAPAFAIVREASKRVMGMRHFDVQMVGGMTLHRGRIAEMKTGEGKTLVATLAVYLNALPGKGVHVVTVNDYLARRDAEWMRPLYEFLGLTIGVIFSGQTGEEKRHAYQCDITYGTNNEFGFDYLRDNMAFSLEDKVQRGLHYAIVDEVDSILIDEARTPLIISGAVDENTDLYKVVNQLAQQLEKGEEIEDEEATVVGDFLVDEKQKQVELTEQGHNKVEELMRAEGLLGDDESLYAAQNLNLLQHMHSALRARHLYNRDVDYIISEGQVVIVDEHTGRSMPGRRWSEGLHQAVEAKEGVTVQRESQTLASTTFQNYFRLYEKLAGMTGTADTEAFEFRQIYGLDVVVIPTNRPLARKDLNDLVYLSAEEKYEAIIKDVKTETEAGRPVLVGTASIETSEYLAKLMREAGLTFNVLNAKQHQSEAEIIAQAGRPGAITIATNMAGRGTDIVLGGNWEAEVAKLQNPSQEQVEALKVEWQARHDGVLAAGGLHVVGSERHESRRIDNQLRGRAGRQGDPGSTRFFLSLEDSLMRLFGSDRVKRLMQALGLEHGEAIEHKMVSNAVERAQKKVEGRNFDIRKQLLEYDDVANDQRRVIYDQRNEILAFSEEQLRERLQTMHREAYAAKIEAAGEKLIRRFEKQVMLQVLDTRWKEHLQSMDHLRRGIHLRGYAQKNPKQEYKRESFELFQQLLEHIKADVTRILSHVQVRQPEEVDALEQQRREALARETATAASRHDTPAQEQPETEQEAPGVDGRPVRREGPKVGRNDPCFCGSGKKYKQCCGKLS